LTINTLFAKFGTNKVIWVMKKVIALAVFMLAICLSFHPCKAQNDKNGHYILSKKLTG